MVGRSPTVFKQLGFLFSFNHDPFPSKIEFSTKKWFIPRFFTPFAIKILLKIQFSTFAFPLFPDLIKLSPTFYERMIHMQYLDLKWILCLSNCLVTQAESQSPWRF